MLWLGVVLRTAAERGTQVGLGCSIEVVELLKIFLEPTTRVQVSRKFTFFLHIKRTIILKSWTSNGNDENTDF